MHKKKSQKPPGFYPQGKYAQVCSLIQKKLSKL